MTDNTIPAALLSAVKRDLRPVRPLASPGRRALALLPLGVILLIGLPAFWGWRGRHDIAVLAPSLSWPGSLLETVTGLVVLAVAFREAIPGRELPIRTLAVVIGGVWAGFLIDNAIVQPIPSSVPLDVTVRWIWRCVAMETAFSIPALAVVTWLVSRALPTRPAWTGALCGMGVAMMADAGLRLFCWDGDLAHILIAHGGAVVVLMVLGALSASLVERIKARR